MSLGLHIPGRSEALVMSAGAINVVLGRNGAGKTRLCRQLAGLDAAPAGVRHVLDGEDITARRARQRSATMVFQEFINYPSLSVFDNIASPLRAARVGRSAIEAEVRALAAPLGLTDMLGRTPDALSGGQQQRVALARALASRARVMLLDEPFANLDLKLREAAVAQLRTLLTERGAVVVYTSSDPREALALADTLLLLADGQVLQAGAPLDLYRAPASVAAANLMSDPGVNLVDVSIDGNTLVLGDNLSVPCPPGLAGRADVLQMAVRPEHLRQAGAVADDIIRLPARVDLAETNGSDTWLHVNVAGAAWVAHLDGLCDLQPGAATELEVSVGDTLLFAGAA